MFSIEGLLNRIAFRVADSFTAKHKTIFCDGFVAGQNWALVLYKNPVRMAKFFGGFYHSNDKEVWAIVDCLLKKKYNVLLVDRRISLEKLAGLLDKECLSRISLAICLIAPGLKNHLELLKKKSDGAMVGIHTSCDPKLSHNQVNAELKKIQERFPEFVYDISKYQKNDLWQAQFMEYSVQCLVVTAMDGGWAARSFSDYQIDPMFIPPTGILDESEQNSGFIGGRDICVLSGNPLEMKGGWRLFDIARSFPDRKIHVFSKETRTFLGLFVKEQMPKNLIFHGLFPANGSYVKRITQNCGYILSLSPFEGLSTGIITGIQLGLLPIATEETGLGNTFEGLPFVRVDSDSNLIQDIASIVEDRQIFEKNVGWREEFLKLVSMNNYRRKMTKAIGYVESLRVQ